MKNYSQNVFFGMKQETIPHFANLKKETIDDNLM